MGDDSLITKPETCEMLRMSIRTLETQVVKTGLLQPVRITPGRVLFRKSDVEALISRKSARTVTSP